MKECVCLRDDFFENDVVKSIEDKYGFRYSIIYIKLLILGCNNDGYLRFKNTEENFIKEISLEIDEEFEVVEKTIEILISKNLIEVISENEYFLKSTEVVKF